MGKKKKKEAAPAVWCFFCDRVFQDENTLVQHQRNKHFKCDNCNKKLNSSKSLAVHSYQVHKINVSSIPGAKPGKDSIEFEIFGMAGVPEGLEPGMDIKELEQAKKQKLEAAAGPAPPGAYPPPMPHLMPPAFPPGAPMHSMPSMGMPPPGMFRPPAPPHPAYSAPRPGSYPPAPVPSSDQLYAPPAAPLSRPSLVGGADTGAAHYAPPPPAGPLFPVSGPPPPRGGGGLMRPPMPLPPAGVRPEGIPYPDASKTFTNAAARPLPDAPDASVGLQSSDAILVCSDEQFSVEEHRSQLSKYRAAVAPSAFPPGQPAWPQVPPPGPRPGAYPPGPGGPGPFPPGPPMPMAMHRQ